MTPSATADVAASETATAMAARLGTLAWPALPSQRPGETALLRSPDNDRMTSSPASDHNHRHIDNDHGNTQLPGPDNEFDLSPADDEDSASDRAGGTVVAKVGGGESGSENLVTTQYVVMLWRRAGERYQRERITLEARIQRLVVRMEEVAVGAEPLRQALAYAEDRLRAITEPSEDELQVRRKVEVERKRSPELSRARRLGDFARSRAAAEAGVADAVRACRAADMEGAQLRAQVASETSVAIARVWRLYEHTERRIASYRRTLLRHHRDGAAVNARLRPAGPKLPTWVHTPDIEQGVNP